MTTRTILTVDEDDGQSDRLTARYKGWQRGSDINLRISISEDRLLSLGNEAGTLIIPNFSPSDIDGLIEYLNDAKQFISEADTVKKLMGEHIWQ